MTEYTGPTTITDPIDLEPAYVEGSTDWLAVHMIWAITVLVLGMSLIIAWAVTR